ncbi:protocatechuate 3,4-dioxygenase subunit alpha [Pokkaliibacter sp. MBI-7]|uniref:protocatechuate 3,4-dioxygenase subunit alpha n=1 Tax=Pokkaliibacter sp. MBI-7 TaxID=3040600 RepID=UPI002447C310|nr:protocatechuate 3,4-dioxygenase subunit alpha [Pokkaliibacter sp. MBI-7]MDH2433572.1 protocatechuate 3,4-dioxygenase subunit alpha [Pokkaliibacter sp. MBI-7]
MADKKLKETPSQTVGPYFAYGLTPRQYGYPLPPITSGKLASDKTQGAAIEIVGQVFDGAGNTVDDAMIEIWQANSSGRFAHPADQREERALDPEFKGFGRMGTGTLPGNHFQFETIKPGSIEEGHAPFINVIVLMRGLLIHSYTRLYFEDEAAANAQDPILSQVPEGRRHTLVAKRVDSPYGVRYRFDIRMQGDNATVFFDY